VDLAVLEPLMTHSDDEFEDRFKNWRRWCLYFDIGRYKHGGRAVSLEGCYSGPQGKGHPYGWGDWDVAAPPQIRINEPIDHWDALDVNRAYTQLPERTRTTIKLIYFPCVDKTGRPLTPKRKAQIIRCHYLDLRETGYMAKRMLRNRLRFLER
jgi:hypothetical protein